MPPGGRPTDPNLRENCSPETTAHQPYAPRGMTSASLRLPLRAVVKSNRRWTLDQIAARLAAHPPHTRTGQEDTMHIGVCIFATDYAIRIDELAREAEARGFESLFVPEHTHIPVSRRTPFPGGDQLPKEYSHTFDPFVSLMAAAAATTRLRIGTGICLIIERDTITLAKEVASLDL